MAPTTTYSYLHGLQHLDVMNAASPERSHSANAILALFRVPASVVGTWNLQTVNGSVLPYLVPQDDFEAVELTSDVLTVDAKGTFTQVSKFRVTQDGEWSMEFEPDSGSYQVNGTAVTFTYDSDRSSGIASLAGNTLTFSAAGFALVYKKQ